MLVSHWSVFPKPTEELFYVLQYQKYLLKYHSTVKFTDQDEILKSNDSFSLVSLVKMTVTVKLLSG